MTHASNDNTTLKINIMNDHNQEILKIKNLFVHYETEYGTVEALNDVSLSIFKGKTLGIVGETGAGKTTLAKSILRIIKSPPGRIVSGSILFEGTEILTMSDKELRALRGSQISMIFQDPMTSLNPVMTVGDQIAEVIYTHEKISKKDAFKKALDMLNMVGIRPERGKDYPHQFSGGMKQRVIIAIALANSSKILIADEPTSALDVTIQAQVLSMIVDLKDKIKTSMILITHDLGVVAQTCDYVAIIYAGRIVEYGTVYNIFKDPKHPYTKGLIGSIPSLVYDVERLQSIKGLMPDPTKLPKGCSFCPRCDMAFDECQTILPDLYNIDDEVHSARCLLFSPERIENDRRRNE